MGSILSLRLTAEALRCSAALAKVLVQPDVRDRLTRWGLAIQLMTDKQLAAREKLYAQTWSQIIRKSGFQPQ